MLLSMSGLVCLTIFREERESTDLFSHGYIDIHSQFRLTVTAVRWFSYKFVDWKFRLISQFFSNFAMLVNVVTGIHENILETAAVFKVCVLPSVAAFFS